MSTPKKPDDSIPSTECAITAFYHCKQCLDELPEGETAALWSRLNVGPTANGYLQVWCARHDAHVLAVRPARRKKNEFFSIVEAKGGTA